MGEAAMSGDLWARQEVLRELTRTDPDPPFAAALMPYSCWPKITRWLGSPACLRPLPIGCERGAHASFPIGARDMQ